MDNHPARRAPARRASAPRRPAPLENWSGGLRPRGPPTRSLAGAPFPRSRLRWSYGGPPKLYAKVAAPAGRACGAA